VIELLEDVQATAALFHLRRATVGSYREENTHPFRMKRWLFAHDGTLANFGDLRPTLLSLLPPFLQRAIRGETDSEHLFALFLAGLKGSDLLDKLEPPRDELAKLLAQSLAQAEALEKRVGVDAPSAHAIAATDGQVMLAASVGDRPLFWKIFGGLERCARCGLGEDSPEDHPLHIAHKSLRSLVISSAGELVGESDERSTHSLLAGTLAEGWRRLPQGKVTAWNRHLDAYEVEI